MGAQFTPGPWELGDYDLSRNGWTIGARGLTVAVGTYLGGTDPAKANANLIAAAPDLYSGCQRAANTFRAYEALHRAKGTPEGDAKAGNNAAMAAELEALCARARGEQP